MKTLLTAVCALALLMMMGCDREDPWNDQPEVYPWIDGARMGQPLQADHLLRKLYGPLHSVDADPSLFPTLELSKTLATGNGDLPPFEESKGQEINADAQPRPSTGTGGDPVGTKGDGNGESFPWIDLP